MEQINDIIKFIAHVPLRILLLVCLPYLSWKNPSTPVDNWWFLNIYSTIYFIHFYTYIIQKKKKKVWWKFFFFFLSFFLVIKNARVTTYQYTSKPQNRSNLLCKVKTLLSTYTAILRFYIHNNTAL